MLHQHLQHTLSSAGLDKAKSDALLSNMQGLVDEVRRDMEKLNIAIFHATESYYKQLQTCRSELEARGVLNAQVDSINVLNKEAS